MGPSDLTEFIKLGGSPPLFPPLSSSPPFSVLKMCLSVKVRASRVQESGIDPQNYKIKSSLRECTTLGCQILPNPLTVIIVSDTTNSISQTKDLVQKAYDEMILSCCLLTSD